MKPAPAVAAPRLPSEADRKPGRQAASQASSLRPAGRATPPRGSRSQAGGPTDRVAHPAAREHPSERPSRSGLRPRGPDAGPEPEGGAPRQRGFAVPVRGRERKRGRGTRLTSRRGGRASVCRNLDTLKRLMAVGTTELAASRTRATTFRCTAGSSDSRTLPLRPRPTALGHAQTCPGQLQPAPAHWAPPPPPLPPRARPRPRP